MKKSIQLFPFLVFSFSTLFSQEITVLDEIKEGIIDYYTVAQGKRFYLTNICDTLWVNGQAVVADDSCTFGPGTKPIYFLSVNGDGSIGFVKNMGKCDGNLVATDSSVVLFTIFHVDTLFSADTSFINNSLFNQGNMVAFEYSFSGELLRAKHWAVTSVDGPRINEVNYVGGDYFLSGSFYGDTLRLDNEYAAAIAPFFSINTVDVFTVKINSEWGCQWIDISGGIVREFHGASVTGPGKGTVSTGNFSSARFACDQDTIYNPYSFLWPDTWLSKIDSLGNCQWLRQVGDINSVTGVGIGELSDGSIFVAGNYSGSEVDFGDALLVNPSAKENSFIAKYSADGDFDFATQFDSGRPPIIHDLAVTAEDAVWVCGVFYSDTLYNNPSIGPFTLPTISYDSDGDGFVAKYDKNGNPLFAVSMGGNESDFNFNIREGDDNNVFLLMRTRSDTVKVGDQVIPINSIGSDLLIEIKDITTATVEQTPAPIKIKTYPNPLSNGQLLHYETSHSEAVDFKQINLYSIYGQALGHFETGGDNGQVALPYLSAGIYLLQFEDEKGRTIQVSKLVVE